ncbi:MULTISPECIES: phycobiliprotein lyase [Microcoleaceae]|uniref:phycobiliprotein lyase n=1 Tax=Microcoleaceae TaxID=1892252 RepID=UPI00187E10D1|nr:phycobiliprotein lyase [Tychonema sp. LEGE 06208]MBE9160805.1 phycobiliprotein lyase [Tychonema sp. LEGE 06208]
MKIQPPMTMMDFFRKSEGTWFSQRSVHHFDAVADESGESNLIIQIMEKDHPKIQEICEKQAVNPALAVGGAIFMWQTTLDAQDKEPNPNYAAILVDIPDRNNPQSGKFLRNQGYVEGIPVIGRYNFATDGVLTIDTEYEKNQGQERCWFITDDFRVRVSTVRMMNGINLMTYSSERRCVAPADLQQIIQQQQLITH